MTPDEETVAALRAIWEQRRESVHERVALIERAVAAAARGALDPELRAAAQGAAHMISGSAGTFGFAKASERARALEGALEGESPIEAAAVSLLAAETAALRAELEGDPHDPERPAVAGAEGAPGSVPDVVVAGDPDLARGLVAALAARGLDASAVPLGGVRDLVRAAPPQLVVLDLGAPQGTGEALDVLTEAGLAAPTAVLTAPHLLVDRVEVARRGGRAFLPRDADGQELADEIVALHRRLRPRDATVLAVDDDPAMLDALRAILGATGLRVETCGEPALFWDELERVRPDLVVLDVEMPKISGLELCRAIRAERRWEELPVMVLTARNDEDTVVEVFAAGADDFIAKPVVGAELVARVQGRLERVRLFRALAETDPLTGLANRRRSYEELEASFADAERLGEPLSLAVIDLDRFKDVNDRYGHAVGDLALRSVASTLRRTFTGTEPVSRWGGDEFVVGLPGLVAADARERLGVFLEDLRGQELGEGLRLTATAGVAELTRDGHDLDGLHHAADQAMYEAKAAGGDRVHDAGAPLQGDAPRVDVVLVEDDQLLADLLERALATRGYSTVHYADGLQAAPALAAARPDVVARVVLLDWDLPHVDGLQVLRTMSENATLRHTRVIMVSARARQEEIETALDAGAWDFVPKPFAVDDLLDRIRRALADG